MASTAQPGRPTMNRTSNREHADLAYHLKAGLALHESCAGALSGLAVDPVQLDQLVVSALYARCLEFHAANLTLVRAKLGAPARAAARVLLETCFVLRAVAGDEVTLRRYVGSDEHFRLQLIEKGRRSTSQPLLGLGSENVERIKEGIELGVRRLDLKKPLTAEDYARRAGLHDEYLVAYPLLSLSVHSGVRDLEDYFDRDEGGEIRSLRLQVSVHPV